MFLGSVCALFLMVLGYMAHNGYWQWQKGDEEFESPSRRYVVWDAFMAYPKYKFGLVMYDREKGGMEVISGWTRRHPWKQDIKWVSDDRLRIEYFDQDTLEWGMKTDVLGVRVDWVVVPKVKN